jgi:hypothetical protein
VEVNKTLDLIIYCIFDFFGFAFILPMIRVVLKRIPDSLLQSGRIQKLVICNDLDEAIIIQNYFNNFYIWIS